MDQLHRRTCFTPILIKDLTKEEKEKAQKALCFLTEKPDGTIKARTIYNGKPTREWLTREDSSSPTASTEGVFLTSVVDAKEERDVMSNDVPNAFIQAQIPEGKTENGDERIVMKITRRLVDILLNIAPEVYGGFVVYGNGQKVLYDRFTSTLRHADLSHAMVQKVSRRSQRRRFCF